MNPAGGQLEERYRKLLRLLPASYRQVWEDDMVATFLASTVPADPEDAEFAVEFGRPSVSHVVDIASLAVRLRIGGPGAPPRAFAWGAAVRLAVLSALLAHAVVSAYGLGIELWLARRIPWLPMPPVEWTELIPVDIRHAAPAVVGFVWVPAYLALVLGQRRVARALAALATVPTAVWTGETVTDTLVRNEPVWRVSTPVLFLLFDLLLILALGAFLDGAPPVRRLRWLLALCGGIALVPLLELPTLGGRPVFDLPALYCAALLAAAVALVRRKSRASAWPHALALLAGVILVLRVGVSLDDLRGAFPGRTAALALGAGEAAVVAVLGLVLAAVAARRLRQLPDDQSHPVSRSAVPPG